MTVVAPVESSADGTLVVPAGPPTEPSAEALAGVSVDLPAEPAAEPIPVAPFVLVAPDVAAGPTGPADPTRAAELAGAVDRPDEPPLARHLRPIERLVSLDAIRGFDMFWIVGGEGLVKAAAKLWPAAEPLRVAGEQLDHKPWEGLAFYDLIFPGFVFLVGVSMAFSLGKQLAVNGRRGAARRVVLRTLVLYALGLLYYGGLSKTFADVRLLGVLQRIALAYGAAGLMFCFWRPRTLAAVCVALLAGYWALLAFVPVPGLGHASFEEGKNLTNWFDARFLPGFKWDGDHDPEGVLSTLPAIGTCLLGLFAGLLLRSARLGPGSKVAALVLGGAAVGALGYLWGGLIPQVPVPDPVRFPIVKKIWTSSFVLAAAGYAAVALGLFYLVVDVAKLRGWVRPFVWVGTNAITLYLIEHFVNYERLAGLLVGGEFNRRVLQDAGELVLQAVAVLLMFAAARFLYRRQLFLRV